MVVYNLIEYNKPLLFFKNNNYNIFLQYIFKWYNILKFNIRIELQTKHWMKCRFRDFMYMNYFKTNPDIYNDANNYTVTENPLFTVNILIL